MAEGRMLKKKISLDSQWADLSNDTHRMLFTIGIAHLDIEGRISGDPREFKAAVVPMLDQITSKKILDFFDDAQRLGLIIRYEVDGKWVIQYPGFKKNQTLRTDRESPSSYPPPPQDYSWTTPGELQEDSRTTPAEVKLSKVKLKKSSLDQKSPQKDNGFDQFWHHYPRKVGKPKALTAWKSLNKRKRLPPLDTIVASLNDQKNWEQWQEDDGKYIPHPSTWLNREGWNDQKPQPEDGMATWATK